MTGLMKYYYLLQTAYWIQQLFVLVLKIEKPRKDYNELIIHHIVTIWLIRLVMLLVENTILTGYQVGAISLT